MTGVKKVDLFNVGSGYLKGDKDLHDDDIDGDNKGYCPSCLKYGIRELLKKRMFKVEVVVDSAIESKPKPKLVPAQVPDADRFRQCHRCGDIVAIYNVKYESKIADFVETIDNPFDSNPGNMSSLKFGGKNTRIDKSPSIYKKRKKYIESIKDPDIKEELKQGNTLTHYFEH